MAQRAIPGHSCQKGPSFLPGNSQNGLKELKEPLLGRFRGSDLSRQAALAQSPILTVLAELTVFGRNTPFYEKSLRI